MSTSELHAVTDSGPPQDDRSVVWLRGEHDIATVPELSRALSEAIAGHDADLLVDLGAVRFLDASTIRALLLGRDALRLQSRSLTVRASGPAARLLVLLGLEDMLEPGAVVDRAEEAG